MRTKKLCPLECIRDYTNLTKSWRVDGSPSKFFLTHKKPHNPARKSTMARWIKQTLLLADVDTKVFQAHSLRGASSSKASLKGLSAKDIVSHGRWSRESTWQRFYHKKVDSSSKKYQDCILKLWRRAWDRRPCGLILRGLHNLVRIINLKFDFILIKSKLYVGPFGSL